MDDTQNTGVINPAEGETATTSPGSEQTPQEDSGAESTPATETTEEKKAIPYSRFKEVNDKVSQYEARLAEYEKRLDSMGKQPEKPADPQEQQIKSLLNQYGYVSRDEIEKKLNEREQRLREDAQVEKELSRLESRYDGKDGLPKFDRKKVVNFAIERRIADPEVAYKTLFEKEYLNWHIQHASEQSRGVKSEKSDGTGARSAGPTNDDLANEYLKGNDEAFNTMVKRTSMFQNFFKK